jgi:hypothetical protein
VSQGRRDGDGGGETEERDGGRSDRGERERERERQKTEETCRDREAAGKGGIRVDSGSNALSLCVDFWRSFNVLSKFSLAVDL